MSAAYDVDALFAEALVWDNHCCLPLWGDGRPDLLPQLERQHRAGAGVAVLNVAFGATPWADTVKTIAQFRRFLDDYPHLYRRVDTVDDILAARAQGRMAVAFDIEGAVAVDDCLQLVEVYATLGVRWMLLAYNQPNRAGGGCLAPDEGLTAFGRALVAELERCGVVVDLSHTGERTAFDALEVATRPVNLSHSNGRALWDHPRNVSDELIRAVASTGGVIGVNGIGAFLGRNDNRTGTLVAHIEHMAEVAGVAHVGLGLDYVFDEAGFAAFLASDPVSYPAEDYPHGMAMIEPERLPKIARALADRGWSRADLLGVLGENQLRVARACWRAAG